MKAINLEKPHVLSLIEKPRLPLQEHEVRIRVQRVGICGSDLHIYEGGIPWVKMPLILGHELSGTIVEIGPHANCEIGQKVSVIPLVYCGQCEFCRKGKTNHCSNLTSYGVQLDGAYAEEIVVADHRVVPLPPEVSLDQGAFLDPLAVAVHAINRAALDQYDAIAILGAGTIGLLAIQVLVAQKCPYILATGRTEKKLKIAEELGAHLIINSTETDVIQAGLHAIPQGYNAILDCVCSDETINQAIMLAKPGASIVLIGAPFPINRPSINYVDVYKKELVLASSRGYLDTEFEEAISLLMKGEIQIEPLVTQRVSLENVPEAIKHLQNRRKESIKILIENMKDN